MNRWALALVAFAAAIAIAMALAIGCGRDMTGDANGSPPIDTEVMAYLSEARALHHQANLKEEAGDVPGAVGAMERLVAAQRPHPEAKLPEVEEVLADAYARLAELELKRNGLPAAAKAIDSGLTHAPEPTYFRGHLDEVQGLVMEATAAELTDAGKKEEAAKAREKAINLLEQVVTIQDQVIQKSLAGRDGATEAPR
jgi:tetratricopeptide (TPR) repeat protein